MLKQHFGSDRLRSYVRPVVAVAPDRGQDGFRDTRSKQTGGLSLPWDHAEFRVSWIDRSRHLLVFLQVRHQISTGELRVVPVSD
jgi:hypothetical protein